jgi:hypothetical protein
MVNLTAGRYLGFGRRPDDPHGDPSTLALAQWAYDRGKLMACLPLVIEIVCRVEHEPGFKVLPRRWVVECTFGLMTR